jgi:predicted secreted Zn-dependent protease
MPEWTPPPEAAADLVERWNRYHTALQRHEDGHKEHGLGAARDVREKLRALDAEPDCDSMNREANAVANRVVEQYKAKDRTFDKETRHGASQGARFP